MEKNVILVAGEASGDLHGSNLAKALKELSPEIKLFGIGSDAMRKAGVNLYRDTKDLSVIGFFDVLKNISKFLELKKLLWEKINEAKPACIIFIDFSGFNLRFIKSLNKKIPVIYYISPQVWASRIGRINTIKKFVDKMIVVFDFEERLYRKFNVDAEFIGHPLLDIVKPTQEKDLTKSEFGLKDYKPIIAILAGSRKSEVKRILPIMLKTAELIKLRLPGVKFVVSKSPNVSEDIYLDFLEKSKVTYSIIEGRTYDCLDVSDFALVCSGTATMEAAIMNKPMVVIYKMSLPTYLLYRPQVKIPYIGMVNIVSGKMIVPEFIQYNARPKKIANCVLKILNSDSKFIQMLDGLKHLKEKLGQSGASKRAAKIVLEFLERRSNEGKTG